MSIKKFKTRKIAKYSLFRLNYLYARLHTKYKENEEGKIISK